MQTVCPKVPGTPGKMMSHLENAVKELSKRKNQLETLVFLFSGNHSKDHGYMLGDKNEFVTKEKLESMMIGLTPEVKKFIVFLDCCSADIFTSLGDANRSLMQLNACDKSEKSIVETGGGIITRFVIQAFTGKARGIECEIKEINQAHTNESCSISGNFITIHRLHTYVHDHVTAYFKTKSNNPKNEQFKPTFTALGANMDTVVVAYNYQNKVELVFIPPETFNPNDIVSVHPDTFQTMDELHYLLFEQTVGKLRSLLQLCFF